jgi:hypothetical protein
MADTDAQAPETGAQNETLENKSVNTEAPQTAAEVEAAKKEAAQALMRANQLENQVKELTTKLTAKETERLQEKEDYKSLWEQSQAKLTEIVEREEQQTFQAQVSKKQEELTSEYSDEVLDIAKTAGINLSGVDEADVTAFKSKLDAINEKVAKSVKNEPENHAQTPQNDADRAQALERLRQGDKSAVTDAVQTLGFIKALQKQREQ